MAEGFRPWPRPEDPDDDDDDFEAKPPELTVEVTDPVVLGYLYGPDGEKAWTLLDRRPIRFGFRGRDG